MQRENLSTRVMKGHPELDLIKNFVLSSGDFKVCADEYFYEIQEILKNRDFYTAEGIEWFFLGMQAAKSLSKSRRYLLRERFLVPYLQDELKIPHAF